MGWPLTLAAGAAGVVGLAAIANRAGLLGKQRVEVRLGADPLLAKLLGNTPSLQEYRPPPFLNVDLHGTLHTVLPFMARQLRRVALEFKRELFQLSDGGTVALDWAVVSAEVDASAPVVIIQHGLCGSSESSYVRHFVREVLHLGWRPVVLVARGCGGVPLTTPEGFHAARTSDFEAALHAIRERYPQSRIYAVGYSLGACILGKYLGDKGAAARLDGAVMVSPQWDFLEKTRVFDLWSSKHLIKGLRKYVEDNEQAFEENDKVDLNKIRRASNVREFDAAAVVPVWGFRDVDHYYTEASPINRSENIVVPTLSLSARDDPVCSADGAPCGDKLGPGLLLLITEQGGHVAFAEGFLPFQESFMDRAATDFLSSLDRLLDERNGNDGTATRVP